MPKNSYKFFTNTPCQFFPCHDNVPKDDFNCLFCFCPLVFSEDCGGEYTMTAKGVKDCSECALPHLSENYGYVIGELEKLILLKQEAK